MDWLKTAALGVLGAAVEGSVVYLGLWRIYGPPTP
jgi:hypothetical protein